MCRGFSHYQTILQHQQGVLQFNSDLTLPTWTPQQILPVRSSAQQDCPSLHFRCQLQVQIATCAFDQLAINGTASSSGSVNLLEWLTELRKIVYLLDCQVYYKVYNSEIARGKSCKEQSSMPSPGA